MNKPRNNDFLKGVVIALDVVAIYHDEVTFMEIVKSAGRGIKAEIMRNGLSQTKALLRRIQNARRK